MPTSFHGSSPVTDVARGRLRAAASRPPPRGVRSLSRQSRRAVPRCPEAAAAKRRRRRRESVCQEHTLLRVLPVHPRQSPQRPVDLWPLRRHTPVPLHRPSDWSVCVQKHFSSFSGSTCLHEIREKMIVYENLTDYDFKAVGSPCNSLIKHCDLCVTALSHHFICVIYIYIFSFCLFVKRHAH